MSATAMAPRLLPETEETARGPYFSEAWSPFEGLIHWAETHEGTFSEVEQGVEQRGRSVLRAVLQGHLDLREAQQVRVSSVEGTDGIARRHHRSKEKRTVGT